ncbi:MAG: hypothetical protein ACE5SW_12405 [Nitrososphaeraceae archaeon]
MKGHLSSLFITLMGLSLLSITYVSIVGVTQSYSQVDAIDSNLGSTIHITKHSSNSYALSKGSSQIGTFDTTYSILGSISSLKASKDLITSTIISDYEKSPFIGYVIAPSSKSSSDMPALANPFTDKATINKKITGELKSAIDSTSKLKTQEAVIKCNLGMEISKWNCITHGLLA